MNGLTPGIRLDHYEDGTPLFVLPFDERNIGNNHLPAIHGDVIAGFLENAAVMHVRHMLEADHMAAALTLLTLKTIQSPWLGMLHIPLFGVGSTAIVLGG